MAMSPSSFEHERRVLIKAADQAAAALQEASVQLREWAEREAFLEKEIERLKAKYEPQA